MATIKRSLKLMVPTIDYEKIKTGRTTALLYRATEGMQKIVEEFKKGKYTALEMRTKETQYDKHIRARWIGTEMHQGAFGVTQKIEWWFKLNFSDVREFED